MTTRQSVGSERLTRFEAALSELTTALETGTVALPESWLRRFGDLLPRPTTRVDGHGLDASAPGSSDGVDGETLVGEAGGATGIDAPATVEDPEATARVDGPNSGVGTVEIPSGGSPPGPGQTGEWGGARPDPTDANGTDSSGFPDPASPGSSVRYFGDYAVHEVLGRGGMGVVYRATQISLGRQVALKMLRDSAFASPEEVRRFQNEAESVATLDHPNIVPIYEIGEHGRSKYYSMKLIEGSGLDARIKDYHDRPAPAAELVAKVADGVQHAHQRGILHRDLKPANILIDARGEPHVTDFGLAKRVESGVDLTQTGAVMGTPAFMSPEQATGHRSEITTATDVYGLGAVLYNLLSGHAPFKGASIVDTLDQVRNRAPEPPSKADPGVPRDLEVICLKCLEKDPRRRYATAAEVADDLRRWLAGEPIEARAVGQATRLWMWCRRNPAMATLAASIALLVTALAIGSTVAAVSIDAKRREAVAATLEARESLRRAQQAEFQASQSSQVAGDQAFLALSTLSELVGKVDKQLAAAPALQPLRRELLAYALERLDQVSALGQKKLVIETTRAGTYMKTGDLYRILGETRKAYDQYKICHEIMQRRYQSSLKGGADRIVASSNLANSDLRLAEMAEMLDRDLSQARTYLREALRLYEFILGDFKIKRLGEVKPDPLPFRVNMGETLARNGTLAMRLGEIRESRGYYERALAIREEIVRTAPDPTGENRQNLARAYLSIGMTGFRLWNLVEARESLERSITMRRDLDREFSTPTPVIYNRRELASSLGVYGEILSQIGEARASLKPLEEARAIDEELVGLDPNDVELSRQLGMSLHRLGHARRLAGDEAGAIEAFGACARVWGGLYERDSANARRRLDLMIVLPKVGEVARAAGWAGDFLAQGDKDPEVVVESAATLAQCSAAASAAGDLEKAALYRGRSLEALKRAAALGYKDVVYVEADPDFAPMKDDPAFKAVWDAMRSARDAPAAPKSRNPEN